MKDKEQDKQPEKMPESGKQGAEQRTEGASPSPSEEQTTQAPHEEGAPRKVIGRPFTSENAREMAMKSQEAQARKKRRGEILQRLLDGKSNDPETLRECERLGIPADEITNEAAICVAMIRQALAGDPKGSAKAAEWIAKVSGMLVERHELTGAEGAPLMPSRPLTPSEARQLLEELENNN